MTARSTRIGSGRVVLVAGLMLVTVLAGPSHGVIGGGKSFFLDFTQPEQARSKAHWSPTDKLTLNEHGLGWDGNEKASYITWIESTDPIAVGWSWRAVYAVSVSAEILPSGRFTRKGHVFTYPPGQFFVRHSPDAKHWSSWQALETQAPAAEDQPPRQQFHGVLRVPERDRRAYLDLLRKYRRMDVPWTSDEEAAVRWIVQGQPDFFEQHQPFIGYVQVLFETKARGGQRLKGLEVHFHYMAGGIVSQPADPTIDKAERHRIPWRYRAP